MDRKIGVFICSGCGIGESVDVQSLAAVAKSTATPPTIHPAICGEEGLALVRQAIQQNGLNTLVIAGCSPRVNADLFAFDVPVVERVNLREQVAWCHVPNDEDTQALAEDYVRMGLARAERTESPEAFVEPQLSSAVLVIGGGIAGLTAAIEAAEAGNEAIIVEKQPVLGGWLGRFHRLSPQRPPYQNVEPTNISQIVDQARVHPKIKVLTGAEVERIAGQPGMFDALVRQNGSSTEVSVGAIVLATGWQPYDATRLKSLGFGLSPNVVTNITMEEMARSGRIRRPSDGKAPKNVAFIQCAGSRPIGANEEGHLPYCSSACCLVSLKQATYVREQCPDANIFIFYRDMRTLGQYEEFYKKVQQDEMVFFTKGEVTTIQPEQGDNLLVKVENTLLGDKIAVAADLVVLATGMVPTTAETQVLHLQYRQGPELPTPKYGFPDSNYICFPYETQRTAIYATGCVRQPQNVAATVEDATGAALKAIQAIYATQNGVAVHPRAGDLSYPSFFLQRCTQCKRCTEECPFGALDEDERGTPKPNLNRCRRCGICFGACPEKIVSFKNYSIDQLTSMIKAIDVPEDEDKPRILALICENDAYPAFDMAGMRRLVYDPSIRIVPLRCLGSMNTVFIADAMSRGIDGVLLIGCKYGDDYQCHFIKGSELADRRMQNVQETLNRLMVEPERVRLLQLSITEHEKIPEILGQFVQEIRTIGPNPYKGF